MNFSCSGTLGPGWCRGEEGRARKGEGGRGEDGRKCRVLLYSSSKSRNNMLDPLDDIHVYYTV